VRNLWNLQQFNNNWEHDIRCCSHSQTLEIFRPSIYWPLFSRHGCAVVNTCTADAQGLRINNQWLYINKKRIRIKTGKHFSVKIFNGQEAAANPKIADLRDYSYFGRVFIYTFLLPKFQQRL
jgi:hypothetical protein